MDMLKKYFSVFFESKYLFYFVLIVNIVLLCFTEFYPSMDGPAHLYNTNILYNLIKGNDVLTEFYKINEIPIPNWTTHAILLFFRSFLPAWLAEKIYLIIYVTGMSFSFRYLIKVLNPGNISLSILVFPLIYSYLFRLGFYNFTFSFILFFVTLGFWLHNNRSNKISKYIILFLLMTVTYFTNTLVFGFLGLTIGLYILYDSYQKYLSDKNVSGAVRFAAGELLKFFIVSLPGLICMVIFLVKIRFPSTDEAYSVKELFKWINDARALIAYSYRSEEIITEHFFHILLILLVLSFVFKSGCFENNQKCELGKANIIAIPLILSIILFFVTPNGANAGMMSDRYCLLLYILGLIWVIARSVKIKFNAVIILVALGIHFGQLFPHFNTVKGLNRDAVAINKAVEHIHENSIVLPVDLSDKWLEIHFSNYLGVEKPLVILENYELSISWFPVKWNMESMPKIFLNDKNSLLAMQWPSNNSSNEIRQIDYILIYGDQSKLGAPEWNELKEELMAGFKLKYKSENNYVILYESK